MKLGLSLVDLAMGGAQNLMLQLAQGMRARGHEVCYYLYARRDDPLHAAPALLEALDAVAQPLARPADLLACDVIQLDGYHNLRRKLPYLLHLRRCVETFHSQYSLRRSGPLYARARVAVSKEVQRLIPGESTLIYSGIPLPALKPHESPRFDAAILGRIHPVKGHLLFLKACEQLYRRRGSLSALLIGGHPGASDYQQAVDAEVERLRRLGLQIEMAGDVPPAEVYGWLQQARLLLVTSESEGFGRMAIEALACGLPVIANPVGGLLEIVQDGSTGYLARKDDPASFAELASRLLDDPVRRMEMGRRGRRDVEERFSQKAMLDSYEIVYRRIAEGTA